MAAEEQFENRSEEKRTSGELFSPAERAACEQAAAGTAPFSQRALALLALDEGATQKDAAQQSGQTLGQVRYWLRKFRKERMAIFPEAAADVDLDQVQGEQPQLEPDPGETSKEREEDPVLVDGDKPEQKLMTESKVKKGKKTKSPKRKKKSKKAGKAKKGKKSKKAKIAKKKTKAKKGKKKKAKGAKKKKKQKKSKKKKT